MAKTTLGMRIDENILKRLDKIAESKGMSRTSILLMLINEYLDKEELKLLNKNNK